VRYQGLAVVYYGCALECLANERLAIVKNPGYSPSNSQSVSKRNTPWFRCSEIKHVILDCLLGERNFFTGQGVLIYESLIKRPVKTKNDISSLIAS
jgi:hypothetical protein